MINKDTNISLNGTVLIKSELTTDLKCIYLEAPSLTAKDGITIAGYNFIGVNSSVSDTYVQKKVLYNFASQGYDIPIKYAQAVLCETADAIYTWPKFTAKKSGFNLFSSFSLIGLILMITLLF